MSEQDEQWFDALAGHSSPASAEDQRLQQALRQAAAIDASEQRDELAERRLLARLEREGLLAAASDAPQPRRVIWPRLAQAAVIMLCLGLMVELSLMPELEQAEMPAPQSPQVVSEELAAAPAQVFEAEVELAPASPPKIPQPPMPAQASSAKPELAKSPAVGLADRAASAFSPQGNSALRSAKAALAKRERQQLPALWVEDVAQALERLAAWQIEVEADSAQESDATDDAWVQLRCDQEATCKALLDTLKALSLKPLPTQPRLGETLRLQLRQKP